MCKNKKNELHFPCKSFSSLHAKKKLIFPWHDVFIRLTGTSQTVAQMITQLGEILKSNVRRGSAAIVVVVVDAPRSRKLLWWKIYIRDADKSPRGGGNANAAAWPSLDDEANI